MANLAIKPPLCCAGLHQLVERLRLIISAVAEAFAEGQEYRWEWDYDTDADWSWMSAEEQQQPHEVLMVSLLDRDDKVLATLGGIFDADANYTRVMQAELALEANARV